MNETILLRNIILTKADQPWQLHWWAAFCLTEC